MTRDESAVLELQPLPGTQAPAIQTTGALAASSPAAIMLAALAQGVSPSDLREMLAIQREWQADQARAAMNEALAAFKAEPLTIAKNKEVGYKTKEGDFVGYKHAELSDVVAAVSPPLAKHGLSFRWDVKQSKDWISVTCILKHKAGHSESVEMGAPPDSSGKKNPIQSIASSTSYLQRYTLKAICGVAEGGEDNDGQDAGDAPEDGSVGREEGKPSAWPDDSFEKQFSRWSKAVIEGIKTTDDILAIARSKGAISEAQEARIRGIAA
ncbi:MAG: ERF family protein [Burkholderiaceae bacterium]